MNQLVEVAMTVIDPGKRRWAQLLNVTQPVRELLPIIVGRLDLPDKLTYELIPLRLGRTLGDGESLQNAGIYAGEELQLKPVRNRVYMDLMDGLYKEAIGYASKQLWGKVQSLLETIFRLDPDYPDPNGLRQAVGLATGAAVAAAQSAAQPPAGQPQPAYTAPQPATATGGQVYGAPQPPPVAQTPAQPYAAPAKAGRSGCATVGLILGGIAVLVVGVVIVGGILLGRGLLSSRESNNTNESIFAPAGGPVLGTGDVQVTLRWGNGADLDLHVIDPAGEEISYTSKTSTSGGQLDVDANGLCSGDAPVENIFWPTGGAPGGSYQITAVYYNDCDNDGPTPYEVTVLINGQVVDQIQGTLSAAGESRFIGEYSR